MASSQIILFKNDLLSCVERKWNMGKSLAGKELGQGVSQRKDGRYQARFTNRFGKRQTIYAKTLNETHQKLRNEQYEDEKKLNVVSSDMTLDNGLMSGWIPVRRIAGIPPEPTIRTRITVSGEVLDGGS